MILGALRELELIDWPVSKINKLKNLLDKLRIGWKDKGEYQRYERDDISSSLAVEVEVIIPNTHVELFPTYRDNAAFDHNNSCKKCGSGSRQIGPLSVRWREKLPFGNVILEPIGVPAWIVGQDLKEKIEVNGFTGVSFLPVLNYQTNSVIDSVWQLFPPNELPKMLIKDCYSKYGVSRECDCENGFVAKVGGGRLLEYPKEIESHLLDINRTGEWFDFTSGAYVLSRRMALFPLDQGIKNIIMFPVLISPNTLF